MEIREIHGGDLVELKNGKTIKVYDIHNDFVVVSVIERYHISEIKRVVKRFGAKQ